MQFYESQELSATDQTVVWASEPIALAAEQLHTAGEP